MLYKTVVTIVLYSLENVETVSKIKPKLSRKPVKAYLGCPL